MHDCTPRGHWETTTMIAALSLGGAVAAMVIEGAADGAVFRAYVKHVLVPVLQPEQIVVLDNLAVHKDAEVRQMIEAVIAGTEQLVRRQSDQIGRASRRERV